MSNNTADILASAQLIIIKVGSMLIRGEALDQVNQDWMDALAGDIVAFRQQGKKIVIVSSGGVALGRKALNISANIAPDSIPLAKKQAASAVGQYHLFNGYFKAFAKHRITAAQVLLTMSETENRRMNLNARETLGALLDNEIIPIINENDTVSTGEIRFGDNDRLSVRVAQMIMADSVILLSTTDGLYTANPDNTPNAQFIDVVTHITDKHKEMAGEALVGLSTGGMKSKIEAAISATKSGINLIITDGRKNNALSKLCSNKQTKSTLFTAQKCDNNARKIWLRSHMNPKGYIVVDDGAARALKSGKSLLPVGVNKIIGDFSRGDVVEIKTIDGGRLAMGVSAYSAVEANKIMGKNTSDIGSILGYLGRKELVHRNDMVL